MCCSSDFISSAHRADRLQTVPMATVPMLSLLFFCKQPVFILAMFYFLITAVMFTAWSL